MNPRRNSGERQLKLFKASLTKILGAENFPREVIGDLSMLLDSLRRAINRLTGLMEFSRSFERDPASKLQELEIELGFVRDLLENLKPALREMIEKAYNVCETHDDEEKALRRIDRMLKKVESLQLKREDRKW